MIFRLLRFLRRYFLQLWEEFIFRTLPYKYKVVYPPQGLGDVLYFYLHQRSYAERYPQKRVGAALTTPHLVELAMIFGTEYINPLYLHEFAVREREGNLDQIGFKYDNLVKRIYGVPDNAQSNLKKTIMCAMGVGLQEEPVVPFREVSNSQCKNFCRLGAQPGKTVLIAPFAVSCKPCMKVEEWVAVAEKLREERFNVFFNAPETELFGDFPTIFLSISDTIDFCNYGGLFIGYRSGLCDVVAAFTCAKQIVIYPNNRIPGELPFVADFDDNPNGKYFEYCSLKTIWPHKEIYEFIYTRDTGTKIDNIIKQWILTTSQSS